jgi:NADH-quinone oxidoreductase subunit E
VSEISREPKSLGAHAAEPKLDVRGNPVKMELGPDERAIAREHVVDALWDEQQKHGWIDDAAVARVAARCLMTPAEVDEVATFYNLLFRSPAAKKVVFVCDSISCHLTGAAALMERVSSELGIQPGETTADGKITLLPIVCLGHCEKAPCLMAGENIHGPCATDPASVRALVTKIRNE